MASNGIPAAALLNPKEVFEVEGALIQPYDIKPGREYVYAKGHPVDCRGQHYMVHRFVVDVPSYQPKVLVEALTGRDRGLWFTTSVANFCVRYEPAESAEGYKKEGEDRCP